VQNKEDPDEEKEEKLFKEPQKIESKVKPANPRT